jgi:NADPH-dependent curcumin reductase CurA
MTGELNHQIRLAARPIGLPKRSDWQFTEKPVPEPRRDGEVLAKVLYLSLDPAMRGWLPRNIPALPWAIMSAA